jgi:hypothetical protein
MAAMDIMLHIDKAFPRPGTLFPGQIVVMTDQSIDIKMSGEQLNDRKIIPVVLSLHTQDKEKIWNSRIPKWEKAARISQALCKEAQEQNGVLTISQLSTYLHSSTSQISQALRKLNKTTTEKALIKGYIEDAGPRLTPPEISEITHHAPQSRDRYLDNFHKVQVYARVLEQVPGETQLSRLLGCRKSVAKQYLNQFKKLFGDKMPDTQPAMEVRA